MTLIERPLLLHRVKFDIRQWFLVSDWNPLTLWVYRDSYLRLCSQEYTNDSKHESVHLSNVAVQQNYLNGKRSSKLPTNNFMTSGEYKDYLNSIGEGDIWDRVTYPAMKSAIISSLSSSIDIQENRKNAFELYGADFILTEDYRPWLLEINSSPGMAATSPEKVKLCAHVIDDLVKVVLDRRENKSCDTGGFELVTKELFCQPISSFKCVDTKFMVEGIKIKKMDLQKYTLLDAKNSKSDRKSAEKEIRKKLNNSEKDTSNNSTKSKKSKSDPSNPAPPPPPPPPPTKSGDDVKMCKSDVNPGEKWTDILARSVQTAAC